MPLTPGTKLGPYKIIAPLGAGGMGEVYRARDTRLGRDVAVKILPAEFSADPVRKQRFEREAKTISGLNHPNICTLHDVGSQDGLEYLVMECLAERPWLPSKTFEGAAEVLTECTRKMPMTTKQIRKGIFVGRESLGRQFEVFGRILLR